MTHGPSQEIAMWEAEEEKLHLLMNGKLSTDEGCILKIVKSMWQFLSSPIGPI